MATKSKRDVRTVRTHSLAPGNPTDQFTTEEIAQDLRRGPRTILRLIKDGKLEARKQGRDWLISREAVQKYMNSLPTSTELAEKETEGFEEE